MYVLTFVRGDFRNRRVSRNWTLVVVVVMCFRSPAKC